MNICIYMSDEDKRTIRMLKPAICNFKIVKIKDKFWIKSKLLTRDYGSFEYNIQAHGWLKLYLKELY